MYHLCLLGDGSLSKQEVPYFSPPPLFVKRFQCDQTLLVIYYFAESIILKNYLAACSAYVFYALIHRNRKCFLFRFPYLACPPWPRCRASRSAGVSFCGRSPNQSDLESKYHKKKEKLNMFYILKCAFMVLNKHGPFNKTEIITHRRGKWLLHNNRKRHVPFSFSLFIYVIYGLGYFRFWCPHYKIIWENTCI